ncbi:hypothetical protein [Paremcibacter congregatus]|uniref:hypothetical protein n=1 Tax=Paremcibacter congregatus TaxID=2043170 RepID=UPI003A947097
MAQQFIKKIQRKIQLKMLEKSTPEGLKKLGEKKLVQRFKSAKKASPALKKLLDEARIDSEAVSSSEDYSQLSFKMAKENTFNRFELEDLCRPGALDALSGVLTSSGHSGNFAYGLTTRQQRKSTPDMIDLALQGVFNIDEKKTLLVNCLPMGVRFPSNVVTQAEVSVREDMALALIRKFSPYHDQVIITCDPLFLKVLLDKAEHWCVDWKKIHKHLIIGEETFGEKFRDYVGSKLHINPDNPATGIIGSSMGVGELGLNLCFETLETISLRRAINNNPVLLRTLFGCKSPKDPLPMLFAYNPLAHYMETADRDNDGFGELLVSLLAKDTPVPLFRYQTGDEARLLETGEIKAAFQALGLPLPQLPNMPLICIRGRHKDRLKTGLHIGAVKDSLYQNHDFADKITGAFRVEADSPGLVHVQLRRKIKSTDVICPDLINQDETLFTSTDIKLWSYEDFPYGQTLDYERKFSYLS